MLSKEQWMLNWEIKYIDDNLRSEKSSFELNNDPFVFAYCFAIGEKNLDGDECFYVRVANIAWLKQHLEKNGGFIAHCLVMSMI